MARSTISSVWTTAAASLTSSFSRESTSHGVAPSTLHVKCSGCLKTQSTQKRPTLLGLRFYFFRLVFKVCVCTVTITASESDLCEFKKKPDSGIVGTRDELSVHTQNSVTHFFREFRHVTFLKMKHRSDSARYM